MQAFAPTCNFTKCSIYTVPPSTLELKGDLDLWCILMGFFYVQKLRRLLADYFHEDSAVQENQHGVFVYNGFLFTNVGNAVSNGDLFTIFLLSFY